MAKITSVEALRAYIAAHTGEGAGGAVQDLGEIGEEGVVALHETYMGSRRAGCKAQKITRVTGAPPCAPSAAGLS